MTLPLTLTQPQTDRIHKLCDILGCDDADVTVIEHSPDLPPRFVAVTIGYAKGRAKHLTIDPEGRPL